ncbi:MAG: ACT domain-containing protein [Candidatus Omnitrophica bacterium]|nr:ACT domain-containing protein [Candidatus Omnitrophota bacterium]
MQCVKAQELVVVADDSVGKLAEISGLLQQQGINIRAVSAWQAEGKAYFRLVTSDNGAAEKALASLGEVSRKEVVLVDMPDEVGKLSEFAGKLGEEGVNITHLYGTTSEPGKSAIVVFSSFDNEKAMACLGSNAAGS